MTAKKDQVSSSWKKGRGRGRETLPQSEASKVAKGATREPSRPPPLPPALPHPDELWPLLGNSSSPPEVFKGPSGPGDKSRVSSGLGWGEWAQTPAWS